MSEDRISQLLAQIEEEARLARIEMREPFTIAIDNVEAQMIMARLGANFTHDFMWSPVPQIAGVPIQRQRERSQYL